jgi:hypothetical protein
MVDNQHVIRAKSGDENLIHSFLFNEFALLYLIITSYLVIFLYITREKQTHYVAVFFTE